MENVSKTLRGLWSDMLMSTKGASSSAFPIISCSRKALAHLLARSSCTPTAAGAIQCKQLEGQPQTQP